MGNLRMKIRHLYHYSYYNYYFPLKKVVVSANLLIMYKAKKKNTIII